MGSAILTRRGGLGRGCRGTHTGIETHGGGGIGASSPGGPPAALCAVLSVGDVRPSHSIMPAVLLVLVR
jgi:hypothetical protein